MVKKVLFVGLLLSFFVFPIYISGQEQTATPTSKLRLRDAQNRADTVQARRDQLIEQMQAKRDEFKKRLLTIRDEVKRRIVERIDNRMVTANQKATDRFSSVLDKLQSLLDKLIGKAQIANSEGKDTANLDAATASAQLSIDAAKAAVASQAANLYVIEIASESALKNSVGATVSKLRIDLRDVHKLVVDAKQSVQNVIMELAKLRGIGIREENTATGSSQ